LILNEMVVGQQIKATKDLGLSVLNLFSLFIVIFLGISQVSGDIGGTSLYFLFSKPVRRSEYLVGTAVAVFMAVFCGVLVITVTIFLLSIFQGEVWIMGLLIAAYLTLLEMLVMLAFALLFTLITSSQLAMFLTLSVYIIGHTIQQAAVIADRSSNLVLKYIILLLYGLCPNLEFFNKKTEIIYHVNIPLSYFLYTTVYSFSYTTLIVLLALYVFKHKEI